MSDDLERYMSARQCADLAGIERDTFTGYVNRGFAPPPWATIGGRRFWHRDEIRAWIKARERRAKRARKGSAAG
jgi:predicted DNA-binding transcriptional regulator AlpA